MGAVLIPPGEGERIGRHVRMKLDLPALCLYEATVGPDFQGAGPHYHERHVDAFHVLEGELEFILGTETHRGGPGTSVVVPPGIVHGFASSGPGTTRYLNLHAPDAGFADYLRRRVAGEDASFDSIDVDGPIGPADATVTDAGGGERLEASDRTITVRGAHEALCFLEFEAREGFGPVTPHVHEDSIDSFYALDGDLGLWADGGERMVAPGSFVAAPPGEEHGILEVRSTVRFLNFHAPDDGFAEFIRSQ